MFHKKVLGVLDDTLVVVENLVVLLFELDTLDELVQRHGILIVGIEVFDRDVVMEDVVDDLVGDVVVNLIELVDDRGSRGQAGGLYGIHLLMEFLETGDDGRVVYVGKSGGWFRGGRFTYLLVFP